MPLHAERTPSAASVVQKVYTEGYGPHEVHHDHLAFRSFGVRHAGCVGQGAALASVTLGTCLGPGQQWSSLGLKGNCMGERPDRL